MKKLKQKTALCAVLFILLIAGSCKKDETTISKAKIGLQKNAPSEIGTKANKEVMATISPEVNWSKSKTYLLEDGTELTTSPMSIEIDGAAKPKGSFLLLIYKKGDKYESLVAYNENKDYFQKSFSKPEIQVIFGSTLAKNLEKTVYKKGINAQVKVRPNEPPVCYDAYWVTYIEDAYGNPIEILSVTYLYTWCEDGSGGSGTDPGGETDQEAINRLMKEMEPIESSGGVTSSFGGSTGDPNERLENYEWGIAGNPLSGYLVVSHETGKHKKVGGEWEWDSLQHMNFAVNNKPTWMEVDVTLNGTAIPLVGRFVAGMTIKCNINVSMMFKGNPIGYPSTPFEKNSPIFTIHP
jgi:hypothetical protein